MKRRQFNKTLGALAALQPFALVPSYVRAQAQKLKVGVILPRSGYLGFIGQSCQKGADLAPGVIK
jgi:branched-chain amino acid transport system substrate-binding protein